MMQHYTELATYERNGFEIIVDKTWEDLDPSGQFDEADLGDIIEKINDGTYEWFMLRVRVMFDSHEMGSHYLGGCCYEDARDVLTDGTAEDCIAEALHEAKGEVQHMAGKLWALQMDLEYADAHQ
tara:strand:- start:400 stop:774 length:375 start_codon:yes stop_codon:yes gene_type:complete